MTDHPTSKFALQLPVHLGASQISIEIIEQNQEFLAITGNQDDSVPSKNLLGCEPYVMLLRACHRCVPRHAVGSATASFSASAETLQYDTIVIGGGVVGSALACGLATSPALQGRKFGIVENFPPKTFDEVVSLVR
jgi:hypothetical protein